MIYERFLFLFSLCAVFAVPLCLRLAFVAGYCALVCEAQLLRLVRSIAAFSYNWLCHSAVSPLAASSLIILG